MPAMRRLALLLLAAPAAFALPAPASADPLCYGVTVVAVSTTTVRHCVPYDNLVACRTHTVAEAGVSVTVQVCQPRK